MSIASLFKYNSLISIPLFLGIAFLLMRFAPDYSYAHHTISRTIGLLEGKRQRFLFRFNFLLKAGLDFGFWFYLVDRGSMNWNSYESILLFMAICMFALLAFFIEGTYHVIHLFLIYGLLVLWCVAEVILAHKTDNVAFIWSTYGLTVIPLLVAFLTLYWKKTNVYVQLLCVSFTYMWLFWFVIGFL